MKNILVIMVVLTAVLALLAAGCRPAIQADRDTLFQVSTISALMKGVYEADIPVGLLKNYGDFGVGTFKDLDGEMLMLEGRIYRAQLNGTIVEVPDDTSTPFAEVTFLDTDATLQPPAGLNLNQLQTAIDGKLPSLNLFYAVRITGSFSYVKTRSVPAQVIPYVPLTEAIKGQQILEQRDVEGTIIGFRCPPYIEGVNVPGYHFHFINKDRTKGGHLLDCTTGPALVTLDNTANFIMELPGNKHFNEVNLGQSDQEGLKKVESGR